MEPEGRAYLHPDGLEYEIAADSFMGPRAVNMRMAHR